MRHIDPDRFFQAVQAASATRAWRKMPLEELQAHILKIRRAAVRQHLTPAEWRVLDRMRKRATALSSQQSVRAWGSGVLASDRANASGRNRGRAGHES